MKIQDSRLVLIKWLSLLASTISLALVITVKSIFIFHRAEIGEGLVMAARIAMLAGIVLAAVTFPRWQSVTALAMALVAGYFLFIPPSPFAIP